MSFSQPNILGDEITTDELADGAVTNAKVNAAAAIALSKLAIVGNVTNAMIAAGAGIPDSKLADAGKTKPVGSYRCTTAEIAHDFSSLSIDLDADCSYIIVKGQGMVTAAADLFIQVNGLTSGYRHQFIMNDSGTVSGANTGESGFLVLPSELLDQNTRQFTFYGVLSYNGVNVDVFDFDGQGACHGEGNIVMGGDCDVTSGGSEVTSVKILLSTGTWNIGTQIDVYKVLL